MSTSSPPKIAIPEPRDTHSSSRALARAVFFIVAALLVPGLLAFGFGTINELQVMAVVFGVAGAAIIISKPFGGLIFFAALLYARPEETFPELGGMHFTLIVAFVTFGGMLLQLMLHRTPLVRSPFMGMMLGFAVIGMVSGFVGGTLSGAVLDFARLLVLVLLIVNLIRTPDRYQAFVTAVIAFTWYLALYSIYLFYTGGALIDNGTNDGIARSIGTGIFSDPNDLAATIVAGIGLTLTRILQQQKSKRALYVGLLVSMIWAIVLTNSRGGLLALITVAGGFCFVFTRRKSLAAVLAAVTIGIIFMAAPTRMTNFDKREESANSRFHFWQEGLTQLTLHPLTGVGYGKFPDVNDGFVAHNSFVNCFAEMGLPGFFFWMGCIYLVFRRDTTSPDMSAEPPPLSRDLIGARLALTGYLVAGFWITRTYSPNLYIFLCLPVAQQIAATGGHVLPIYGETEKARVYARIVGLCIGMIFLIRILVEGK